jgi:hypothetical protein
MKLFDFWLEKYASSKKEKIKKKKKRKTGPEGYHKHMKGFKLIKKAELSESRRDSLGSGEFAIPEERKFPIQSRKQAKTAMAYANWPNNAKYKQQVLSVVRRKYPDLGE